MAKSWKGKLEPIPSWVGPALQGMTFWLGAQHAMDVDAQVSEGAMAWELTTLMHAHRSREEFLEAEVFYSSIPELRVSNDFRADLVLATIRRDSRTTPYKKGEVKAIIEVKHNRSRKDLVWDDIDRLGRQRTNAKSVRAFLIYVSASVRPADFTRENGFILKGQDRDKETKNKTAYRVRAVRRALAKASQDYVKTEGFYAVLIEVMPSRVKR